MTLGLLASMQSNHDPYFTEIEMSIALSTYCFSKLDGMAGEFEATFMLYLGALRPFSSIYLPLVTSTATCLSAFLPLCKNRIIAQTHAEDRKLHSDHFTSTEVPVFSASEGHRQIQFPLHVEYTRTNDNYST